MNISRYEHRSHSLNCFILQLLSSCRHGGRGANRQVVFPRKGKVVSVIEAFQELAIWALYLHSVAVGTEGTLADKLSLISELHEASEVEATAYLSGN